MDAKGKIFKYSEIVEQKKKILQFEKQKYSTSFLKCSTILKKKFQGN